MANNKHECNKEAVITKVFTDLATLEERSKNQDKFNQQILKTQEQIANNVKHLSEEWQEAKGGLKLGKWAVYVSLTALSVVGWDKLFGG